MTKYVYRDLQFDPIRIRFGETHAFRFGETHAFRFDESVTAFMARMGRFAKAAKVDPTRLTAVTSSTICEFLGMEVYRWRHLVTDISKSPLGTPPPPRFPGGPRRGRGVTDIWCLELDIIPWLLSTKAGSELLAQVLVDVKVEMGVHAAAVAKKAVAAGSRSKARLSA